MPQLKNKIAVVTGGSSGIGLATAKRFVEEGAYVFIAGRRQAELDEAVAEIGQNVTAVKADISKLDDLDRFYEAVAKKGKIDEIFAGAAFVEKQMTTTATPEHFDKTFNTNARGTYFTVQKALPYRKRGRQAARNTRDRMGFGEPRHYLRDSRRQPPRSIGRHARGSRSRARRRTQEATG